MSHERGRRAGSRPTLRGEGPAATLTAAELAQLPARLEERVPYAEGRALGYRWADMFHGAPWGRGEARAFTAGTVADASAVRALRARYACEYCGEAPATGYVRAYRARVCEACFEEHHGCGGVL